MPCVLMLISHLIAEGSEGDGMVGRAGAWADVSRQFTFNLLGRLPLNTVIIMKNPFHKETGMFIWSLRGSATFLFLISETPHSNWLAAVNTV